MPRDEEPRWFVDETSLGLARALATVRGDVLHPGHRRLLEVPLSTPDPEWMPIVAERGLVVISRDWHIRTKQAELQAYIDHGLRAFWIAGDKDLGNWENLSRIVKWWDRMERIVRERPDGPWFYELFQTSIREVAVRPRMRSAGPSSRPRLAPPRSVSSQLELGLGS